MGLVDSILGNFNENNTSTKTVPGGHIISAWTTCNPLEEYLCQEKEQNSQFSEHHPATGKGNKVIDSVKTSYHALFFIGTIAFQSSLTLVLLIMGHFGFFY